jgi:anti-sigma B factor antagonist
MDSEQMGIEQIDGVQVLTIRGEHDLYTAPPLRESISALLDSRVPVVVDLTQATFIDSSILGVLLGGLRRARESGGSFALVLGEESEATVQRIFEVTGLLSVFPVHRSTGTAIERARSDRPG